MKKIVALVLCLIVMSLPLTSLAAPEFLGSSYVGTVDYLVDILNPDSFSTTTSNSVCVVSAGGKGGHKRCNLYVRRVNRYVPQNQYIF